MKLNLITTKEILDFEKEIGCELVVSEIAIDAGGPTLASNYEARFENADVRKYGIHVSTYGSGDTVDKAIKDYCEKVSRCLVAFNAYLGERKAIQLLVHTKLLGQ